MRVLNVLRPLATPFNIICALLLAGVLVLRAVQAGPLGSTVDPALLEPDTGPAAISQSLRLYLAAGDADNSYLVATRRVSLDADTPARRAEAAAREWATAKPPAGALSLLPPGDLVPTVLVRRELAVVDLPRAWAAVSGGSAGELLVLCGLARTILEFTKLKQVQYTLAGQPAATLAGHVALGRPFTTEGCGGG